jgi:two-component system, chemotaxis family, protein-glutamate methylesterase/glutaminase
MKPTSEAAGRDVIVIGASAGGVHALCEVIEFEPSGFTCPDCGGSLYERPGEQPLHFRCRTGHAFSPESLLAKQSDSLEAALWAALRSLEENAAMARRMEKRAREHGNEMSRRRYERRGQEADKHSKLLRSMLEAGGAADHLASEAG